VNLPKSTKKLIIGIQDLKEFSGTDNKGDDDVLAGLHHGLEEVSEIGAVYSTCGSDMLDLIKHQNVRL
jgi:hypothetical protein